MNICKRLALSFYWQGRVRKNLFHIRDKRFLLPIIRRSLFESAKYWPEVLGKFKPRTIIDIGAHTGQIAEQLSVLYKPDFMVLVEPLPEFSVVLRERHFAPVQKVFDCALGPQNGIAELNIVASKASSSILEITTGLDEVFDRPMNIEDKIKVPMRTLDEIYSECGEQIIDLIKIDVQGFELEVFKGGIKALRNTKFIVSEVSFFKHYKEQAMFEDIYIFLKERGFRMRGTEGWLFDKNGLPLQCDAVFINEKYFKK